MYFSVVIEKQNDFSFVVEKLVPFRISLTKNLR